MTLGLLALSSMANAQESQDSIQYGGWNKYQIGGYGEMIAAFKDYYNVGNKRYTTAGTTKQNYNTISIPRLVLAGDYKFNKKWILGVEIEFESGGVGTSYELENNSENGEYETEIERGGEVAIEQFHITRLIDRAFNVRLGHVIVPVGQNNANHEPINFFGTVRPEDETTIIPSTWHETGIEFFGTFGKGHYTFDYQAQVMSGLNVNGFDKFTWAGGAKQGIFEEENFTSPGYAGRIDYRGVRGLQIGGYIYYCNNIGANADKSAAYESIGKIPVYIYGMDAEYINRWVEARFNIMCGNLPKSAELTGINNKLSNKSPYTRQVPIANKALSYGGEIGFNIQNIVNDDRCPKLFPFVRYAYCNPQEKVTGMDTADLRAKESIFVAGLNWNALPQLVFKADYTTRKIGGGKYVSENEFAIAVAWAGWFSKK